jgi:hypothetical protein
MRSWTTSLVSAVALVLALSGCATRQQTMLGKASPPAITTVTLVPAAGNSPEMNANLEAALLQQGLQIKAPLPAGSRGNSLADATVSYVDVWRWDVSMYLKSLKIRFIDARTGDLLASGEWNDSDLHGFRDAKAVMGDLVADMVAKLRAASARRGI